MNSFRSFNVFRYEPVNSLCNISSHAEVYNAIAKWIELHNYAVSVDNEAELSDVFEVVSYDNTIERYSIDDFANDYDGALYSAIRDLFACNRTAKQLIETAEQLLKFFKEKYDSYPKFKSAYNEDYIFAAPDALVREMAENELSELMSYMQTIDIKSMPLYEVNNELQHTSFVIDNANWFLYPELLSSDKLKDD